MKNTQKGFVHLQVFFVLAVVVIAVGYVAINVTNEAKNQLREDAALNSSQAAESYFGAALPSQANSAPAQSNGTSSSQPKSSTSTNPTKAIAGNANPNQKPSLPPQVAPPKTSIDSIRTFFNAAKSGDFVTANALMGPKLANGLAIVSKTQDPAKALQACNANSTCKLVLFSFQPPADGSFKTTKYTAPSGKPGEQISFPLSKSSPLIASQIGDYNIDIFSEKYAGDIWVIQDVYINGKPVEKFISSL